MSDMPDVHVLVIIHDVHFRKRITTYLSLENFHVLECENEEEVARIFESKETIDVAVVDIHVEEKKGLRCVEFIKHNYNETEVIVLGNHDQIGLAIQGMQMGAFDAIMAPFEMKLFKMSIVKAYYHRKKALKFP